MTAVWVWVGWPLSFVFLNFVFFIISCCWFFFFFFFFFFLGWFVLPDFICMSMNAVCGSAFHNFYIYMFLFFF